MQASIAAWRTDTPLDLLWVAKEHGGLTRLGSDLKAVIPAAGLGTRLLSATKEQPKEMLPVFTRSNGFLCLKPLVQLIFEELFQFGVREFCFVVGRGKRAIEDHFTPDHEFVRYLKAKGKNSQGAKLETFYSKIKASKIAWVNQPKPIGFGDAVLKCEFMVGKALFLVHAGDTYIISSTTSILERLMKDHLRRSADATLVLQEVSDTRQYGVAEVLTRSRGLEVRSVVEKPSRPRSNLAIMPIYVFEPSIFEALRTTPIDKSGEIQLTTAIQMLIKGGCAVNAIKLRDDDGRLEIGTPDTYWEALALSYRRATS